MSNKSVEMSAKIVIVFFIFLAALLGSLLVFGAISSDTFSESLTKLGTVSLIAIVASVLVSLVTGKK